MRKGTKKTKTVAPMDDSIREEKVGKPAANNARVCYALVTLVSEVSEMFPEVPVEYSNVNGRNTSLDATFDLTPLDVQDRGLFSDLFRLLGDSAYNEDRRVAEVVVDGDQVLVSMRNDPRTMDSREPFGMADALLVLADEEGSR